MPINVPILIKESQNEDLDFVGVLRDCLACAIISINERRQITAFNPQAEQITGLASSQVIGQLCESLPAPLPELIHKVFATGQAIADERVVLQAAEGGEMSLTVNVTPAGADAGQVSGVVVVMNDVSSIKNWEGNMRRLDRLHSIGTLSAGMAHEVKNALVAVKTFVDLLLEKNREVELADIVRREMSRIESIVGQMLKFSRRVPPAFSRIHLNFVLNKSLLLIQHLMEEKKIRLTRSLAAEPDWVAGDPDQLEQAFLNLFLNALDAMPEKGILTVTTQLLPAEANPDEPSPEAAPRQLRLVIQDSGVGITPEHLERLYEPFFTTKPDGTGLGLPITRRIIQEHKGTISVHSAPGQGTAFTILLPLSRS